MPLKKKKKTIAREIFFHTIGVFKTNYFITRTVLVCSTLLSVSGMTQCIAILFLR